MKVETALGVVQECHLLCVFESGYFTIQQLTTEARAAVQPVTSCLSSLALWIKTCAATPSFFTWLLGIEFTSTCLPSTCFTNQVFSLAQEATFLNNGHIFIYAVTFIYSVPECGGTPMLKEESASEQRIVVIHCIMGLGCCSSCVFFFKYFAYLFIFILLQNMTAYPLVANGQRKPEKG